MLSEYHKLLADTNIETTKKTAVDSSIEKSHPVIITRGVNVADVIDSLFVLSGNLT